VKVKVKVDYTATDQSIDPKSTWSQ